MAKLVILSAPSGCGKTTLAKALIERLNTVAVATSHTTRAIRSGETDGKDYHFISVEKFQEMQQSNAFLEHARVFDNYYGTSNAAVQTLIDHGQHVLLDIDWQGARQVRTIRPDVTTVFIVPPSLDALEQRLRTRNQDSDKTIARRMQAAEDEISHQSEYNHVVINDHFDTALAELETILQTTN